MDYVEWVEKVLHAAVQARAHADELSHEYNGMNFRHIGGELGFTLEELENSEEGKPGRAVLDALMDLSDLGLLEQKSPGNFKLTRQGTRAALDGLVSLWPSIISTRLDEDQLRVLTPLVQEGPVEFGGYVGVRRIILWHTSDPREGPYGGLRIFGILQELDKDHMVRNHSENGMALARATYQGIVRLTRTDDRLAEIEKSKKANSPLKKPRSQVFISYSHKDKKWLTLLQTFLKPYIRDELLTVWEDTLIKPGDKWKEEIKKALASAGIAVLLVSPYFLASDFIATDELPPLLKAAEEEGLRIVWIAVSYSAYKRTAIGQYQCANDTGKPLSSLNGSRRNKTLVEVCEFIMEAAKHTETQVAALDNNALSTITQPPKPDVAFTPLTETQMYVLRLRAEGKTYSEISREMGISYERAKQIFEQISSELGANNQNEVLRIARTRKLIY